VRVRSKREIDCKVLALRALQQAWPCPPSSLMRRRQMQGQAKAKAEGKYVVSYAHPAPSIAGQSI